MHDDAVTRVRLGWGGVRVNLDVVNFRLTGEDVIDWRTAISAADAFLCMWDPTLGRSEERVS